jgi:deoxyadenosine/deoxycytidine kinase
MPILLSLDGNIGAGKTTLLDLLSEILPSLKLVKEPVEEWLTMKDATGTSILQLYYDYPKRYAYLFQHTALMTRIRNTKDAIAAAGDNDVIISERSIFTDRYVFAEMLRRDGSLSSIEWDLYLRWFDLLAGMMKLNGIIMIDTPPTVCSERIAIRKRKGEEHIPLKYLEDLHAVHNEWLAHTNVPVLRIPTDVTRNKEVLSNMITEFMKTLKNDS